MLRFALYRAPSADRVVPWELSDVLYYARLEESPPCTLRLS